MRGTIIMWSGEKGAISAGGQRYDFDINHWQGAVAPAANMTVEVTVTDGGLAGVTPVNEADLAKEKLAAMTGKGGEVAKAVFANVGMDVAIGRIPHPSPASPAANRGWAAQAERALGELGVKL